jgi:DNA-binding NtrC family response regulator
MDKYKKKLSRNVRLSAEAADALLRYDYPGNIRELENTIERCATLAMAEVIGREELPSDVTADAEKSHILSVLKATRGVKTKAAEILGISRKTLWEKMNAYGIK